MKKLALIAAICAAAPVAANTWIGETADGIHIASITKDSSEIAVICDVGINAPITSINFTVNDIAPEPLTNVALFFDNDAPFFVKTDIEGAIGSVSLKEADNFNNVVALLKSKSKLKVRLFDGSTQTFALSGSSKAIGECMADHTTFVLASG